MTRLVLGRLPSAAPPRPPADPPRRWTDPRPLAAFAALLVGAVWAVHIARPGAPSETSADVGFARGMSEHHAQAVAMAESIRAKTDDPDVRALATDIALTQQAQIGQMRGWLDVWGRPVAGRDDPMSWMGHGGTEMPGMATNRQLDDLDKATGEAADEGFLRLMIRHHRGGLLMASAGVAQADQDEVRTLARAIRDGQSAEITAMEQLLAELGAEPETTPVTMADRADGSSQESTGPGGLRFAPFVLIGGALGWLMQDHWRRRSTRRSEPEERPRAGRRAHSSQFVLVLAGTTQLALALRALLAPRGDLTTAHAWRELGATEIALGAGLLFSAAQPRRAVSLLPVAVALVVMSIAGGIVDLSQGRTDPLAEGKHVLEVVALGALAVLAHRERFGSPAGPNEWADLPTTVEG